MMLVVQASQLLTVNVWIHLDGFNCRLDESVGSRNVEFMIILSELANERICIRSCHNRFDTCGLNPATEL